jgi:hypothetical protein
MLKLHRVPRLGCRKKAVRPCLMVSGRANENFYSGWLTICFICGIIAQTIQQSKAMKKSLSVFGSSERRWAVKIFVKEAENSFLSCMAERFSH